MMNDVYSQKILGFAGNITRIGKLEDADASATVHSRLCGSVVTVYLKSDGYIVTDFAHEVKACALGQASAALMASLIIGCKLSELIELHQQMHAMFKTNGAAPDGKFADFRYFEPIRDYKSRHASTLLTFDAVAQCIKIIEEQKAVCTAEG